MQRIDRRGFLKDTGYLSIGFSLWGSLGFCTSPHLGNQHSALSPDKSQIDAWLRITEEGRILVLTGRMELGQGTIVVMQQVAGEELNINPSRIEVVIADTGLTPNEGYTAGSRAVEQGAMSVRNAAAAARERLLAEAAVQMKTPVEELTVNESGISDIDGKLLSFRDILNGKQLSFEIPSGVKLKPKDQYQWVGKPIPHPDLPKIVRGEAVYVQDLMMEGMVHARIVRPPNYHSKLIEFDTDAIHLPGVLKIERNGSFLGVIAEEEYQAVRAWEHLAKTTKWETIGNPTEGNSLKDFGIEDRKELDRMDKTLFATYTKPYTMHGSIGPSCAVAKFTDGDLHVWSHTQGPYPLRSSLSHLLNIPEGRIRVTGTRGSGCYGHNGADDVAAEAALLSRSFPGRPVRLQWMRADEHGWEPYGSAMRIEISAELDSSSKIGRWQSNLWSDTHSTRPRGNAGNFISARVLENPFDFSSGNRVGGGTRNSQPYYNIPNSSVSDHFVPGPLRVSALRSLGAFGNIFAIESFMDELAEKAGVDPIDFRIAHLSDNRAIEVIQRLRELTQDVKPANREGIGFAFSRYKNTAAYCAVAAYLHIDMSEKTIRPLKMWSVIDAGETINPDGMKNQTEGGMIQALSWVLLEEVKFDTLAITSRDWTTYPILRYMMVPETDVHVIARPEMPPLGAGEAAQGPAAAAIANAIYRASGKRIRNVPLEKHLFEE